MKKQLLILTLFLTSCLGTHQLNSYPESEPQGVHELPMVEDAVMNSRAALKSGNNLGLSVPATPPPDNPTPNFNTEEYDSPEENTFVAAITNPISVFGADVDRASFTNIRRMLNNSRKPTPGAVRIEEMINYFDYNYPAPKNDCPVEISAQVSDCPWNNKHKLMRIGLQAQNIETENLPPANLVFLIDVSGSMDDENKLPLLVRSFKILIDGLRPQDRVSVVTYSGNVNPAIEPTECNDEGKQKIITYLEGLKANGYTNGNQGLEKAYQMAEKHLIKNGNNRVILATDGDFNVGPSSNSELKQFVENHRDKGVFLTVLGFGMGNYKDSKMQTLADYGNGNYAYIDNISEAKKSLGTELWGTLYTVAKDVKILADFNPAKVKAYRLIGYENRVMAAEDFRNDKKDAGDMGSGHSVTALYEIIPANSDEKIDNIQSEYTVPQNIKKSENWATLRFRYKNPNDSTAKEKDFPVLKTAYTQNPDENFKLAATVAQFGLLLKDSKYKGNANYKDLITQAQNLKSDKNGYVDELKVLIRRASEL